jgi:hypothetical protein
MTGPGGDIVPIELDDVPGSELPVGRRAPACPADQHSAPDVLMPFTLGSLPFEQRAGGTGWGRRRRSYPSTTSGRRGPAPVRAGVPAITDAPHRRPQKLDLGTPVPGSTRVGPDADGATSKSKIAVGM